MLNFSNPANFFSSVIQAPLNLVQTGTGLAGSLLGGIFGGGQPQQQQAGSNLLPVLLLGGGAVVLLLVLK